MKSSFYARRIGVAFVVRGVDRWLARLRKSIALAWNGVGWAFYDIPRRCFFFAGVWQSATLAGLVVLVLDDHN